MSVSVALASYNGELFLGRQLESIARQTQLPDQVVVSDGGSDDGSVELVRDFFAAHPALGGVLVADGTCLGVSANFERAIAATTGELVALCDQDDVWAPDRLERGAAAFDDPTVLLTHSNARLVDAAGAPIGIGLFAALGVGGRELAQLAGPDAFALLIRRNLITGATAMVRRDLLNLALPFPEEWVHDEWLGILAAATGGIVPLSAELIDYRQHGGNQIGVAPPTLRGKVRRMLEPRRDRYVRFARRSTVLAERLDEIGAPEKSRLLARRKVEFEGSRAQYGGHRRSRIVPVLRNARGGGYAAFSSQRRLDLFRDLLQPE